MTCSYVDRFEPAEKEALKMAIEALRQLNFINDWIAGHDTAKDDIKNFCQKEIVRSEHEDDIRDMYYTGYRYGLCRVMQHIERM